MMQDSRALRLQTQAAPALASGRDPEKGDELRVHGDLVTGKRWFAFFLPPQRQLGDAFTPP
jgi:hypothetical protein